MSTNKQLIETTIDILAADRTALANLAGKTFLITGAEGMLGRAFQSQLERYVPTAHCFSLSKSQLDVRDPDSFGPFAYLKPDYVVHCAALVDADYCEDHEEEGRGSIVFGTRNVVDFARRCDAKLLYPQSFLIYDGAEPLIDERTAPQPLSVYGRLKLEAEQLVIDSEQSALSVRMGGFFGGESSDNNFVGRVTPHLAKLIHEGVTSIDIGNRVWQPTYTNDLAANCLILLATDCAGIFCMASHGSASFHELTVEIAIQLDISDKISIGCIDSAVLAAKENARRPQSAILQNLRLKNEGLDRQRSWRKSLAEYLNKPYFKELFL
jgi:dTDP-4-dehydrorhamnose reductase